MANQPTITFSKPLQRILASFQKTTESDADEGGAKIHVSDTVSRLAFVYEKFRNIIDYKEDHLLRKNAIHRILKRRLLAGGSGETVARPLVIELIQARYLPNDQVADSKVAAVKQIVDRYLLLAHASGEHLQWAERDEQQRWLLGLCAVEIEQALSSNRKDRAVADAMYEVIINDIVVVGPEKVDTRVRNLQLFLAIQRALLKSDEVMVSYALFRLHVPDWNTMDDAAVHALGARFGEIRDELDLLAHFICGKDGLDRLDAGARIQQPANPVRGVPSAPHEHHRSSFEPQHHRHNHAEKIP